MSHQANIIAGDIITVIIHSAAFTAWIASLSHLDSASEAFGGVVEPTSAVCEVVSVLA
jgi:hypothetical protein